MCVLTEHDGRENANKGAGSPIMAAAKKSRADCRRIVKQYVSHGTDGGAGSSRRYSEKQREAAMSAVPHLALPDAVHWSRAAAFARVGQERAMAS